MFPIHASTATAGTSAPRPLWIAVAIFAINALLVAQTDALPRLLMPAESSAGSVLVGELEDARARGPVEVLRSRSIQYDRAVEAALLREGERTQQRQTAGASAFTLNLFPDTNLDFTVERVERTADRKGWTVFGRDAISGAGRAILTFYGGALSGSVRLANGEFYELHVPPGGKGEVRQSAFRGYLPGASDTALVPLDELRGDTSSGAVSAVLDPSKSSPIPPVRENSGIAQLDILVVYTARAAAAKGGNAGMLAFIHQVFAESNQAMANSEAPVSFRLVHAAPVNYDESTLSADSSGYNVALNALRSPTDGLMDEAHALRNQYGADLVSLWLSPPKPVGAGFVVGQAYLMTHGTNVASYANFAFSAVDVDYAGGVSMTFPHEIGHNLGCAHDRNSTTVSGIFPDSYGYQQSSISPRFHTIMAYSAGCPGCTRVDHFSNPNVNFQGIPTGIGGQMDNVKALAYTSPIAANWRPTATGDGCAFSVNPASVVMPPSGGTAAITVTATTGCSWMAQTTANWVVISAGDSGTGPGTVILTVSPNTLPAPRSAILTVAGTGVTVEQRATATLPVFSASPAEISLAAEVGSEEPIEAEISFSTGAVSSDIELTSHLPAWLRLSETSFRTPAKVTLSVDRTAMAPGNHNTVLRFTASGTQNPVIEIPVYLSVRTGRYLLASAGASFRVAPGTPFDAQRFRVKAPWGVMTPPVLRTVGGGWLSAAVSPAGSLFELQVQVSAASLSTGIYEGRVELSCGDGACEVASFPVRLEVAQPEGGSSGAPSPRIASGGVVNGASFEQGITPGAWMSLFGTQLASSTRVWTSQDFQGELFPLELDGVRVRVDGLPVAVQYISPGQINFQAPSLLRTGWLWVDIVSPAGADRISVYSAPALPGFFQFHSDGQLAALHPGGEPVTALAGAGGVSGRPAKVGTVVELYGTGFGPTNPPVPSGRIFSGAAPLASANQFRITVGGVPAQVEFAGLSAAGLNQLNVKIPAVEPGLKAVFATIDGVPAQFIGRLAVE